MIFVVQVDEPVEHLVDMAFEKYWPEASKEKEE